MSTKGLCPMITPFGMALEEFKDDLDGIIDYNWEDEVEDFEQQLFEEGADATHAFVRLHRLNNVLRVLNQEYPRGLGESLWNELLKDKTYYACDNCHHIDAKVDPIPPTYWQNVQGGEIAPAGFCVVCGCAVFPV